MLRRGRHAGTAQQGDTLARAVYTPSRRLGGTESSTRPVAARRPASASTRRRPPALTRHVSERRASLGSRARNAGSGGGPGKTRQSWAEIRAQVVGWQTNLREVTLQRPDSPTHSQVGHAGTCSAAFVADRVSCAPTAPGKEVHGRPAGHGAISSDFAAGVAPASGKLEAPRVQRRGGWLFNVRGWHSGAATSPLSRYRPS